MIRVAAAIQIMAAALSTRAVVKFMGSSEPFLI
jgi:hypothetical protein